MDRQEEFYDQETADESPNRMRERLAHLAKSVGVREQLFLAITEVGRGKEVGIQNGGNEGRSSLVDSMSGCERD